VNELSKGEARDNPFVLRPPFGGNRMWRFETKSCGKAEFGRKAQRQDFHLNSKISSQRCRASKHVILFPLSFSRLAHLAPADFAFSSAQRHCHHKLVQDQMTH
jgi:hypothetical protein